MINSIHQNFQFSTPFLRGYRKLKMPIVDDNGAPVWPELFPLSKIEQMRNTVGARHFSSQMMLEYINEERVRLDPGALRFYDDNFDIFSAKLGDNQITGACVYWDPSSGRTGGDSSVCVLIYLDDKNRRAFIHDIKYLVVPDSDLHPLSSQCDAVLDFMQTHKQKVISIEVNGMGNALPEILRELAQKKEQGVIVKKIINHQNKETRILDAIEPLLTTGRLFAHEKIKSTLLLSEMLGWSPLSKYGRDDGLDALAGALRMQAIPVRALSQIFKPYSANTNFKI